MKRQLAIAVLALTVITGTAFADTSAADQGDGMSARSDDRTSHVPAAGQDNLPPSPYGLSNDPAFNYNWNP